jgi:hypothetical protein
MISRNRPQRSLKEWREKPEWERGGLRLIIFPSSPFRFTPLFAIEQVHG